VTHRKRLGDWALREMSEEGVSFGKALQLTNVLRDVPGDLAHGPVLPAGARAGRLGLGTGATCSSPRARPARCRCIARLVGLALEHYNVAWDYNARDPAARVAHAAGLRVASHDRIGYSGRARRPSESLERADTDQDLGGAPCAPCWRSRRFTVWSNGALAAHAARLRARIAVLISFLRS